MSTSLRLLHLFRKKNFPVFLQIILFAVSFVLNNKQKKTHENIFKKPTQSNINWNDIIKLFKALGSVIIDRDGSRGFAKLNDCRIVLHAPHPGKETDKGAVNDVKIFLERAGVTP